MISPKYGEVYYIKPANQVGSEQFAGRPAIVVSNDTGNRCSEIVEVVFLTSQPKENMPTHVHIEGRGKLVDSTALCEQISTVSKLRLSDRVCTLDSETMERVQIGMMISLNMISDARYGNIFIDQAKQILELKAQMKVYKHVYREILSVVKGDDNG